MNKRFAGVMWVCPKPFLELSLAGWRSNRRIDTPQYANSMSRSLHVSVGQLLGPLNQSFFLSYHRASAAGWANLIARELDGQDMAVYIDIQRQDNATAFPGRLIKAIQTCDIFVCIVSATSLESSGVRKEIQIACESNKPMVPIVQEDFQFPSEFLNSEDHIRTLLEYDAVTLLDLRNVYVKAAILELIQRIKLCCGGS